MNRIFTILVTTSTLNLMVVAVDVTAPQVTYCPDDITKQAPSDQYKMTVTWLEPGATDETDFETVKSRDSGSEFYVGSTYVTYWFIDSRNNYSKCQFRVTITSKEYPPFDFTPPTLTCPPQKRESVPPSVSSTRVHFQIDVQDNSEGKPWVYVYPPSGSSFDVGVTKVWASATDGSGNSAFCTFDVIVSVSDDICLPNPCTQGKMCYRDADNTEYKCDSGSGGIPTTEQTATTDTSTEQLGACRNTNLILGAVFGSIIAVLVIEVIIFAVCRRYHLINDKILKSNPISPPASHRYTNNPVTEEGTEALPAGSSPSANGRIGASNPVYETNINSPGYQGLDPVSREKEHKYMAMKDNGYVVREVVDGDGAGNDEDTTSTAEYMEVLP